MRSDIIKKGIARAPHRALLYSAGVSKRNINKGLSILLNTFFIRSPIIYIITYFFNF